MKRGIYFRAWHKKKKRMSGLITMLGLMHGTVLMDFNIDSIDINDLIWMQYTGLEDKDNQHIYEGDIITNGDNICGVVEFYSCGFWVVPIIDGNINYDAIDDFLGTIKGTGHPNTIKVLGNIYENDLDIISMAKEHSKTMEGLARK